MGESTEYAKKKAPSPGRGLEAPVHDYNPCKDRAGRELQNRVLLSLPLGATLSRGNSFFFRSGQRYKVIPSPRMLGITIAQHISIAIEPAFPGGSEVKESACNVGDLGLIPGSGRSPGEGNSNPLQYSCLENAMDRAVFSPGESPGRRSLVSNSPRGRKEWTRRSSFTSSEPASFLPAPPAPSSYRNTPLGLLFVQLKCSTQPTVQTEPLVIWCRFTGATFLSRPRTQNSAAEFGRVGAVHQLLPLATWPCFHSLFHNTGN